MRPTSNKIVRKPLTVIIVTLFTLKGMSRWLIQRIKAMLLYIVHGILFVNTVNMKIKAHKCIECHVCRHCRYTGVCGSYTTPYTEYYEVWKLYFTLYHRWYNKQTQQLAESCCQSPLQQWCSITLSRPHVTRHLYTKIVLSRTF